MPQPTRQPHAYSARSGYVQAYRAFHHGQGLDEHHGGTAAVREQTVYDIMWGIGRS
jgi:hypothetical protein